MRLNRYADVPEKRLLFHRRVLQHVLEAKGCEENVTDMAILRRYVYFFAPEDHEDYHSHGWYQCQCRKGTSRIEQDK